MPKDPVTLPVVWAEEPRFGGVDNWVFPVTCRVCGKIHPVRGVSIGLRNVFCCGQTHSWSPCSWCINHYFCTGCVVTVGKKETLTKFSLAKGLGAPIPYMAALELPTLEES